MPKLITKEEASLPDVKLTIPRDKFLALPQDIRDTLAYFEVNRDLGRYRVPGYRFREWENQLSHLLVSK